MAHPTLPIIEYVFHLSNKNMNMENLDNLM